MAPGEMAFRSTPMSVPESVTVDPEAAFCSTRWSVVLATRDGQARRAALEALCRTYWLPVYCFICRRGSDPVDAEDLTQSFFLDLLDGDFFDHLDPQKGRFRGYLCAALKNFLVDQTRSQTTQKRGGRIEFVRWEDATAAERFAKYDRPGLEPDAAYDHHWALTLIGRAFERLAEEQASAGKAKSFAVLRAFLTGSPSAGEYEAAGEQLGTNRKNVSVLVHRLSQRFGEIVRMEVAETVQNPDEVADEMRHLQAALRA